MNHHFVRFLGLLLIAACVQSCAGSRHCELTDLRFVASGQQLDDNASIVWYGFSFKGEEVEFMQERDCLPVLKNCSKYGQEPCVLIMKVESDSRLVISDSYTIDSSYRDEDGRYIYSLYYNSRKLMPLQEYPFPVTRSYPGRETLVINISLQVGFSLEGERKEKRLFVIGYHDKDDKKARFAVDMPQNALMSLVKGLVKDPADVALVYRDTIVSPIRNMEVWQERKFENRRLVDLQ